MILDFLLLTKGFSNACKSKQKEPKENPYLGYATGWLGLFLLRLVLGGVISVLVFFLSEYETSLSVRFFLLINGLTLLYIFVKLMRMKADGVRLYILYSAYDLLINIIYLMPYLSDLIHKEITYSIFLEQVCISISAIISGLTLVYLFTSRQVKTYYPKKMRKLTKWDYIVCIVYVLSHWLTEFTAFNGLEAIQ